MHQRVRRVIGAGSLALVAGELGESEARAVGTDLRGQREQAFVDSAQLFGSEVLVVDRTQNLALAGERKMAQGFKEVEVRELRVVERSGRSWVPEEAAKCWERKVTADGSQAASPDSAVTSNWNCRQRSPWRLPLI